jgi:hypothetical protein
VIAHTDRGLTHSTPRRAKCLDSPSELTNSCRSVTVELVARSWGNARQTLENLRIEDGVLIGDGQSVGSLTPTAVYGIS